MPRVYEPAGPAENKAAGPAETKNKAPIQEVKPTAENAGKKDNGGSDK